MMKMLLVFLVILAAHIQGSTADTSVTQSPVSKSVGLGETVSLRCTASRGVDDDLSWYLQKPGQPLKLLFYKISTRQSGTPSHFSSSGSEPEFTLTVSGVQAEDAGDYYCMGAYVGQRTFGGGTKLIVDLGVSRPTLSVLPPSSKELQGDRATVVCLASGGFPSSWRLDWKVGGSSSSSGVSRSLEVLGGDGRYSWSSTLSLSADQWRKAGSVSCEASLSGQSPVTQSLDPDHCSE